MEYKIKKAKSGIKINPKNKGKFNATKKATGETTEELTHSKNPVTKKRAVFAQNAAKWHHKTGGQVQYKDAMDNKLKTAPKIANDKKGAKLNPKVNLVKKDQAGSKVKPVLLKGPTITPKDNYSTSEPIKSKTDLVGAMGKEVPQNTGHYKTIIPKKTNLLAKKQQGGKLDISNILALWKK